MHGRTNRPAGRLSFCGEQRGGYNYPLEANRIRNISISSVAHELQMVERHHRSIAFTHSRMRAYVKILVSIILGDCTLPQSAYDDGCIIESVQRDDQDLMYV